MKEKFWVKSLRAVEKLQRNSEIILSIFQQTCIFCLSTIKRSLSSPFVVYIITLEVVWALSSQCSHQILYSFVIPTKFSVGEDVE